jgi:hypothetical protein
MAVPSAQRRYRQLVTKHILNRKPFQGSMNGPFHRGTKQLGFQISNGLSLIKFPK